MKKKSLPPVIDENTTILIVGVMPGEKSLQEKEYYANPTNQFWEIISSIFNEGNVPVNYEERIGILKKNKIGLWDVLKDCEGKGSSNANIRNETFNDFELLFKQYPNIKKIIFNGKETYKEYYSKVNWDKKITCQLPSTSSQNTHKTKEKKTEEWKAAFLEKPIKK